MPVSWSLCIVIVWATTLLDTRFTSAQCSGKNDSSYCYPGICSNGRCECIPGFTGEDCRTRLVLLRRREAVYTGSTLVKLPPQYSNNDSVYINVKNFTSFRISWTASYQTENLPNLNVVDKNNDPVYPNVRKVSLTSVFSSDEFSSTGYASGHWDCREAGSRDDPVAVAACDYTLDTKHWIPAHGDRILYKIHVESGGYLQLQDGAGTITRNYTGRVLNDEVFYYFDFDDPYHCVDVSSGCRTTMLDAGSDVTSEATITITWKFWTDDPAGVRKYDLQIRQLSGSRGSEMTEIFDSPAVYINVTDSGQTVTLPHVGVYSIILTVTDNAGNSRLSRRFVFFDDDLDDVTIQSDSPVRVLSVCALVCSPETGYEWLTRLDPSGGPTSVVLDWTNHFVNLPHHNQGWLKPIGSYVRGTIERDYDQYFGRRGRAAIPNTLGVTEFRVFYDIDHRGGRTTLNVSEDNSDNWSNGTTSTQAIYNLTLVDGDSIRFWVEARDIAGHFVRDDVLIHADSSPPIIEEFQVVPDWSGGRAEPCFLCSYVDIRTYDVHSGLRSIEWHLFHNHTGTEVETNRETLPLDGLRKDTDDCDPSSCKCVPVGDCYTVNYISKLGYRIGTFDYFITLSVTNYARLVATKTIKANHTVTKDNVGQVAECLEFLTSNTSSVDGEVLDSVADLLDDLVDTQDVSAQVTESVVMVVNNLLQADHNDTTNAANASSRIVQALERQISNVLAAGSNFSQITDSVAVIARNFQRGSLVDGVTFAALSGVSTANSSADYDVDVYHGSEEEISMDRVEASVRLPGAILTKLSSGDPVPIRFIVYKNSNLFRSDLIGSPQSADVRSSVGSRVISASVLNISVDNLPPDQSVVTAFRLKEVASELKTLDQTAKCVFWNFSLRDGIGDWSTKGCRLDSSANGRAMCHCNHATNFAVLMNIYGNKYASPELDIFSKIGCGVSVVALVITIIIHSAIRSLRAKTSSRILISFSASLLCLYLVFLAGVEQTSSRVGCIIVAVLLHYFNLTSMAWMGVEATNMYLKLVKIFNARVAHFMVKASVVAWGFPMVVVGVILAVDYKEYDNKENEYSCFLKPGSAFYYGQLLIIGLVLLYNVIIFVMVLRKLTCRASKIRSSADRNRRAKILKRLQNIVAISVLLGLTWAFGLLSLIDPVSFDFQVLFSVFNSLQGLSMFLLFVACQDEIRKYVGNLVRRKQAASESDSTSNNRLKLRGKPVKESTSTNTNTKETSGV